jgi:hypothetical protein
MSFGGRELLAEVTPQKSGREKLGRHPAAPKPELSCALNAYDCVKRERWEAIDAAGKP